MRRRKYYSDKPFVLDETRRYQEYLEIKEVSTKAEIAEIFGVSRARVTQCLNLLKLPKPIVQFLEENRENAEIKRYFTERRLRPLTWIGNDEAKIEEFNKIVSLKVK